MASIFPNLLNFADMNLYDLIQLVATIILAVAAITVGVHASRLNEQSGEAGRKVAEAAQQSMQHGKMMRETELNIAVLGRIIEVYNFFIKDIFVTNFFAKENEEPLRKKCNEVLYQSAFLFNQEVNGVVERSVYRILAAYTDGIPSYTQEEYDRARNNQSAGLEIKIYEAFIKREDTAEDTRKTYENTLEKLVFLSNIRFDIENAFECFKLNLGPERIDSL